MVYNGTTRAIIQNPHQYFPMNCDCHLSCLDSIMMEKKKVELLNFKAVKTNLEHSFDNQSLKKNQQVLLEDMRVSCLVTKYFGVKFFIKILRN